MLALNPIVFVVDPDASVRASLEVLIRRAGWIPRTFATAGEFLAGPRPTAPSCLLLETSLPDLGGFDLQQRLAAERPEMPIVVLSSQGDVPTTVRAMKAGAVEFLPKPLVTEAVLAAVALAVAKSDALLRQEAEMLELRQRYETLSSREREVMARVVAGLLNKQVGAALGISEITVKAHRGKVMRKMEADSLADLVGMALTLRLPAAPVSGFRSGTGRLERLIPVRQVPAEAYASAGAQLVGS